MSDYDSRLVEYALGSLDPEGRNEMERALRDRADLRAQLKEVTALFEKIGAAQAPTAPDPKVRERLLKSVNASTRFEGYLERLADLFDLGVARLREILAGAENDAGVWHDSGVAGVSLMHFDGGPRVATADCGLVRLEPGCTFPRHTHHGDEHALVLRGEVHDDSGCVFRPGDFAHMPAGSSHSFTAGDAEPLLLAVVLYGALEAV